MSLNMEVSTTKLSKLQLSLGFQDITWVSGQVFLFRDFVKLADEQGLDAVFATCPYGDLDEGQRGTFAACFQNPRLRRIVSQWWEVYDDERATGNIPSVGGFWGPRTPPSEDHESKPSSRLGGYHDIIRLAGLVFLRRGFVKNVDADGLEATIAYESAYGDLDEGQQRTFAACFHNPRLRQIVSQWWKVYDEERSHRLIPRATVEGIFWDV